MMKNRTQKFCRISLLFSHRFDHGAAPKIERKMSPLNIAFDRYASIGTVMHYILVISPRYLEQESAKEPFQSSSQAAICYYQSNYSKVETNSLSALPIGTTSELARLSPH